MRAKQLTGKIDKRGCFRFLYFTKRSLQSHSTSKMSAVHKPCGLGKIFAHVKEYYLSKGIY